jgi:hypothetical protein
MLAPASMSALRLLSILPSLILLSLILLRALVLRQSGPYAIVQTQINPESRI